MEWMVEFQQEITLLQDQFRELNRIYTSSPSLAQDETTSLVIAEEGLSELSVWLNALPSEQAMWQPANVRLIASYYINVNLICVLEALKAHLKEAVDEPVVHLLSDMMEKTRTLGKGLVRFFSFQESLFAESTILRLHPRVLTDILRIWLFPGVTKQPFTILTTHENAAVLYHPFDTIRMIHTIAGSLFSRETPVTVTLTSDQQFFCIALRRKGFHLTSDAWQRLTDSLAESIEGLREIGGNIEPLTWDEGQGEGVIVRLAWADSSYHESGEQEG